MPVFVENTDWKPDGPTVVSVGAFDGIHAGHQSILRKLTTEQKSLHAESLLFTFDPHPKKVLFPEKEVRLLTVKPEKKDILRNFDLDYVLFYPFNRDFARMTGEEFLAFLKSHYRIKKLILGFNHVFGSDRLADDNLIRKLARKYGFEVERMPAVKVNGIVVSSTEIKKRLRNYDVKTANMLLGYEYMMYGMVREGSKFGRKIGYPTANLHPLSDDKFIPPDGVYAVYVHRESRKIGGVMNIGTRPTVDGSRRLIEVHLFDFKGDLYDELLKVHIVDFIRPEQRFPSVEALQQQIARDIIAAKIKLKKTIKD